jgi:hypothetical protein
MTRLLPHRRQSERELPSPRPGDQRAARGQLAQPVDDLAADGAERVLERGHVRRRVVELDGTADRKLAAADRDARGRGSRRRHPQRDGDGGQA